MVADRENYFAPTKVSQQAKAAATDQAARLIVSAEVSAREKKTAKLRAMRLEQSDSAPAPEPTSPKKRKAKK